MKLIIIAAVSLDGVIGIDEEIPWYIPEDFKHYKETTMGNTLIVGSTTFQTLPKPAHKGRKFLILSKHDHPNFDKEQYKFYKSFEDLFDYLESDEHDLEQVYVIGGSMIYDALIDSCDEAIITWVNKTFHNGNKKFPIGDLFATFTAKGDYDWVTSKSGTQYCIRRHVRNGSNETKND